VHALPEDRHRDAAEVFGGAYLVGPVTDQMWERSLPTYQGSLVQGIIEDDGSVGGWPGRSRCSCPFPEERCRRPQ